MYLEINVARGSPEATRQSEGLWGPWQALNWDLEACNDMLTPNASQMGPAARFYLYHI